MTNIAPLPPKRTEAEDRRLAAVHEAGHQIVATHVGVVAFNPRIWRCRDPEMFNKSWIGNIRVHGAAAAYELRQVAVAGAIAEAAWRGEDVEDIDFDDPATMSPTDWRWAGTEPGDGGSDDLLNAAEAVFALLRRDGGPLWPDLVFEARRLILDARFEAGEDFRGRSLLPSMARPPFHPVGPAAARS